MHEGNWPIIEFEKVTDAIDLSMKMGQLGSRKANDQNFMFTQDGQVIIHTIFFLVSLSALAAIAQWYCLLTASTLSFCI